VRQVHLICSLTSNCDFICSALLQVEPPVESDRTRGYARLREDQEAGTFIDNQIMTPAFVKFAL
jgi:hypothetical protein